MRLLDKISRNLIDVVIWVALLLIGILCIILIMQLFKSSYSCNLNFLSASSAIILIIKILGFLFSFLVAAITLKKTIDIQTIDSLAKLRTMLNSNEKNEVHRRLIIESNNKDELSLDELDYIGTIELGAIMHRKGIISDGELYNQFGYRVENIVNSSLNVKISSDSQYYKDFLYIRDIIGKYSKKTNSR